MFIRCVIIEDEPLAQKKLESFIDKVSYLTLLKTFDSALNAISFLKDHSVDLIFLDIHLEDFTGIQFLESVNHNSKIVITTAYNEYALKGYEFEVSDYLLKPITFERFLQAVEKVHRYFSDSQILKDDFLFVKTDYRLERIQFSEILYIEGMSEYIKIVTCDRKIIIHQSLKGILELLPVQMFTRVHRSFVVSVSKVDRVEKNSVRVRDKAIPLGETYRESFFQRIGLGS